MEYEKLRRSVLGAIATILYDCVGAKTKWVSPNNSVFYDVELDTVFAGTKHDIDVVNTGCPHVLVHRKEWVKHYPDNISDVPKCAKLLLPLVMPELVGAIKHIHWRVVHAPTLSEMYVVCVNDKTTYKDFVYMWRHWSNGEGDNFTREQAEQLAATYTAMTGDYAVRVEPVKKVSEEKRDGSERH